MGKRHKIVYSVVSTDHTTDEPVDTCVVGTYRNRDEAVSACVDYIMERIHLRPDIRYAFMNDEYHNSRQAISKTCKIHQAKLKKMFAFRIDDGWEMPEDVECAVRDYVMSVAEGGCYHMVTDMSSSIGFEEFLFEIQENELH